MNAEFFFIHEFQNVLFAHRVSPRLAALQFGRPGSIALSSPDGLQELANRRRKLLHLTGLPLDRRRDYKAQPLSA